jgi:hypothetical protein
MARHSPELVRQYLIPTILALINGSVFLLFLPRVASRCLEVPYGQLFIPLIRPAIATALCSPVLFLASWALGKLGLTWNPLTLVGVGLAFGAAYGLVSTAVVLHPEERSRFIWKPLARLLGR